MLTCTFCQAVSYDRLFSRYDDTVAGGVFSINAMPNRVRIADTSTDTDTFELRHVITSSQSKIIFKTYFFSFGLFIC